MNAFQTTVLLAVTLGVVIGIGAARRMSKPGLTGATLLTTFVTMTTTFTAIGVFGLIANVHAQIFYPKYAATIIDYESNWESSADGDDQLMHRAILQFTDNSGTEITRRSGTASSWPPTIGDTVTIYYRDGRAYEPSVVMYLALGVLLFVMGYISTYAGFFAAGWDRRRLERVGIVGFLYVLAPGALALMGGGLLWALYDYVWGRNVSDVTAISATFALVMFFVVGAVAVKYTQFLLGRSKSID